MLKPLTSFLPLEKQLTAPASDTMVRDPSKGAPLLQSVFR